MYGKSNNCSIYGLILSEDEAMGYPVHFPYVGELRINTMPMNAMFFHFPFLRENAWTRKVEKTETKTYHADSVSVY